MRLRSVRDVRGFTLIELLVVVMIVGLLAMLAVDAFVQSIQRARQSRTVSDMRTIAAGIEAHSIDTGRYPPAAAFTLPDGLALPTADILGAVPYLAPTYVRVVPLVDGWSSWFTYGTEGTDAQHYALRSMGKGGLADTVPVWGPTTSFEADIVIVDGQFVQYPAGSQK